MAHAETPVDVASAFVLCLNIVWTLSLAPETENRERIDAQANDEQGETQK
jgi:hypothetical protein